MHDQPELNEGEWSLICELLERERDELPSEIHHTRNHELREILKLLRQMIDALLDKVPKGELV